MKIRTAAEWALGAPKQALIEIDREIVAKMGLRGFIRVAWPQLMFSVPYIHGRHIDCISECLEAVSRRELQYLMINIPPRHMKLCADGTPVPTPDGYRQHGDLAPGDLVFGPDGTPTKILRISPRGIADMEVRFSTGETIKVNGDHLWTVYDRWAHKWKTLSTSELAALPVESDRSRFFVPDHERLEFTPPNDSLPIHPYFLGCWIGDGSATKPCITHHADDSEHISKLISLGYCPHVVHGKSSTKHSYFSYQGIAQALQKIGVFGRKHIPDIYAQAPVSDRLELLAGIIDTDGHVEPSTGRVRISTCDPDLSVQIERLAFSLGFKAYTVKAKAPGYGKYPSDKDVFQVCFNPTSDIPTAIPRKKIHRINPTSRRRAIVEIKKSMNPEVGHCITVDRADGLYLVGRTHLVTHNSINVSIMWPVWDWIQNPWRQFLFSSYAQVLSVRDAVRSRRLLMSPWFKERWGEGFSLAGDQNQKTRYDNDKGGYRIATSVEGFATGEGGNIVACDDPHNVSDTNSDTMRESVLTWWDESMSSRRNDPVRDAYLIIMQRIHPRDLCGHILEKERDGWTHLCLPARFEESHPFLSVKDWRQRDGELLWPERIPEEAQTKLESKMGAFVVAGQQQQRPSPREGGMFKRRFFEIVDVAPPVVRRVRAWDLAGTEKQSGNDPDWTAGVQIGVTAEGRYVVMDVARDRLSPGATETLVYNTATQDGKKVKIRLPQDPGQAGKSQVVSYTKKLAGFSVRAVPPTGSKVQRAEPLATQAEIVGILVVRGPWNEAFLDELCNFPGVVHDDQVDAAADAFNELVEPGSTGMLEYMRGKAAEKAAEEAAKNQATNA